MLKIIPYKMGSKSARELARALGVLRIRTPGYVQKRTDFIVNWGASDPNVLGMFYRQWLNLPHAVEKAANKLWTLQALQQASVPCPEFTTNQMEAFGWAEDVKVVVRHTLTGHSGQGIEIVRPEHNCMPLAPLYTKYFKKQQEYRVHVFNGRVIDVTQKKRPSDYLEDDGHNPLIRNHSNGWIFCRTDVVAPACVLDSSIRAVACLGLDFGAVDIGFNTDTGQCAVFEVNSAPGLENTTLDRYVEALTPYVRQRAA